MLGRFFLLLLLLWRKEGRKEEERLCIAIYLPGLYSSTVIFEVFALEWIESG